MIIDIGTEVDESVIRWKHKETDEWQKADIDELIEAYESIVRCKDCEYKVHCHQTVSHTKIHEDFKEYWAEPINFCSKAKMKGDNE